MRFFVFEPVVVRWEGAPVGGRSVVWFCVWMAVSRWRSEGKKHRGEWSRQCRQGGRKGGVLMIIFVVGHESVRA